MKAIDFVVPWVDGNDPEWWKKRDLFVSPDDIEGNNPARFRDWGIFRYWFRAVEENAPWVRTIYLVTDHQIPAFINATHPKLRIVSHDEYIPTKYLPTFSSHPIELNFHRLPDLSNFFVYFNDDMFINQPMAPEDFFRDGKPCYAFVERPLVPRCPVDMIQSIAINDMGVINRHWSRSGIRKKTWLYLNHRYGRHAWKNLLLLPWREFQHFEDNHMPCPYLKSTLEEVWERAVDILDATCSHRFRSREDVNQYLFRYWALASGNFSPAYRKSGYYSLADQNVSDAVHDIEDGIHAMICLNDGGPDHFETLQQKIHQAFQRRYPNPCSFEK